MRTVVAIGTRAVEVDAEETKAKLPGNNKKRKTLYAYPLHGFLSILLCAVVDSFPMHESDVFAACYF